MLLDCISIAWYVMIVIEIICYDAVLTALFAENVLDFISYDILLFLQLKTVGQLC